MALNLTLTDEEIKSYDQEVKDAKKPKIPNGALVKALLYDIDATQSAVKRAAEQNREVTIKDGLAVSFAALGYWKDANSPYVEIINYADPLNPIFPFGKEINPKMSYYLNTAMLKFAGYVEPKDDRQCMILYHQMLERDLGIPHGTVKFSDGVVDPPFICNFYRYIDSYYKKEDLMDDKVTPKPGAKQEVKSILYWYELELNEKKNLVKPYRRVNLEQTPAPVEFIPIATSAKVFEVVSETFKPKPKDDTPF